MWVQSYDYLEHHGIKGQKWGVRRYQNPDGTLTDEGKRRYAKRVFVSGSSKTQDETSVYYRKELPDQIKDRLRRFVDEKAEIIVGDAPGIDRQVQNFLNDLGYSNVQVYGPGKKVRYSANSKWKTNPIDAPEFEVGSREWLAKKDLEMEKASTEGLAIVLDEGSKATRKNIDRLISNNKYVGVFELSKDGKDRDRWADRLSHDSGFAKETIDMYTPSYDYLEHHGIEGQKWGKKNGPPYPLGYNDHSTAEKKANPKGRLDNYDDKQAKKDFKKVQKAKRYGGKVDALAKTKTVKQIYKTHQDELITLRAEREKVLQKWQKAYDEEMAKHKGEKHPDYEWENISWEAEKAASKKVGPELTKKSTDYVNRCKELAEEAFGDFSKMNVSDIVRPGDAYPSIENYIQDAINKIDDSMWARKMVTGKYVYLDED